MGTKYTSQSISGYNSNPPADDDSRTDANKLTWAKHKGKLADPLVDQVTAIQAALVTHFDESAVDKAINFTTTADEHKRVIEVSADVTISLGDASTMGVGYIVSIKNLHSAAITVDLATGTDTLDDTVDGDVTVQANESFVLCVNAAADGYIKIGNNYQTNAEIKAANEANADTNPFTDSEKTLLGTLDPLEIEDNGVSLTTGATKINFTGFNVTEPSADEIRISSLGVSGDSQLALTTVATSASGLDYHSEPRVVELNSGTLFMVYMKAAAHDDNSTTIVYSTSTDEGATWTSPTTLYNPASGYAGRNPGLSYSTTDDRITVFAREWQSGTAQHDLVFFNSTDDGATWGSETSIHSLFSPATVVAPFGKAIETSNGLMQAFYDADVAWALYSTDDGETWGSLTTIYDLTQALATFNEPILIPIDEDRIMVVVREDVDKDRYYALKSEDGGSTWGSGIEIPDIAGAAINTAAPCAAAVVGEKIITAWANRSNDYTLYTAKVSKEYFWQRPQLGFAPAGGEPVQRYWRTLSADGTAGDAEFGYPDLAAVSFLSENALLSWYDSKTGDGTTDTDVMILSTINA